MAVAEEELVAVPLREADVVLGVLAEPVLVLLALGVPDEERNKATLRLRMVAFATPASLASQVYTNENTPLEQPLQGISIVTLV